MQCNQCQKPMLALFLTYVCEHCDSQKNVSPKTGTYYAHCTPSFRALLLKSASGTTTWAYPTLEDSREHFGSHSHTTCMLIQPLKPPPEGTYMFFAFASRALAEACKGANIPIAYYAGDTDP